MLMLPSNHYYRNYFKTMILTITTKSTTKKQQQENNNKNMLPINNKKNWLSQWKSFVCSRLLSDYIVYLVYHIIVGDKVI